MDYDTQKAEALKAYYALANCSLVTVQSYVNRTPALLKAIDAACNISNLAGYNDTAYAENMTICRSMMSDATTNSKKCQALTNSSTEQCSCWANQTVLMKKIREFDCAAKKTQKAVTAHKVWRFSAMQDELQ